MELCLNFPQHWPRSLCQKCRLQVTAKYAYTLRMWLCMKWYGAWLYSVHRTRQDGSRFMWHQPCQRCKYTTSVDIQKRAIKLEKLFTHVESHASAVSLLNSGEQRYIKAISIDTVLLPITLNTEWRRKFYSVTEIDEADQDIAVLSTILSHKNWDLWQRSTSDYIIYNRFQAHVQAEPEACRLMEW